MECPLSLNLSWIEINGGRLGNNLQSFRGILSPDTGLMVVVKSNAYGHGLSVVSDAIRDQVDWFGVDSLAEALEVEHVAPGKPVLILGYSRIEDAAEIVRREFRQVTYRQDMAQALSEAAGISGKTAKIHLKIETGTNRQGIPLDEVTAFSQFVSRLPGIEVEGAYTHFANIEDTLDPSFAKLQLERFGQAITQLEEAGIRPTHIHADATAGILLYPETHFTMVRLGIGAYGIWPSRESRIAARERGREVKLEPVLTWKTRIVQLKNIEAGEYVGYGLSFRANRATTLAVIPVGYYEGFDRALSNVGQALVGGAPVPIVGRVAMNMTVLDVTDVAPRLDDEVVLIGRQGESEITADELANKAGTIAYEIVSRINPLLERRLI
jgi:alanine racemase